MKSSNMAKREYTGCSKLVTVASNLAFFQNFQVPETKNYLNIEYYLPTLASKIKFGLKMGLKVENCQKIT